MPVHVLDLGEVRPPAGHLRAAAGTCPIRGVAIEQGDGVILFDTGVAGDHPLINEWFEPAVVSVGDALAAAGVDERDVVAIVNSHLHFDHRGRNRSSRRCPCGCSARSTSW